MARQQQVIGLMVRHGFIDEAEADAALAGASRAARGPHPDASTARGCDRAATSRSTCATCCRCSSARDKVDGQLRVTTTLDASLQAKAEEIVHVADLDRLEPQVGATNGALVAMDPRTGEILAMVGSHDFFRDDISGQVNNALALNQPGSTMKPMTYLAAFMKGWSPSTIVDDEPLRIADGESSYILNNADMRYRGRVSARAALGSSLNVPAVKALEYAGLQHRLHAGEAHGTVPPSMNAASASLSGRVLWHRPT